MMQNEKPRVTMRISQQLFKCCIGGEGEGSQTTKAEP